VPKVVRFTKLTNDGAVKDGPLATDGSRVFFNETFPDGSNHIFQVSVEGGESVPLSVPLKQPKLLDLSKAGNELLLANEVEEYSSFWVQPGSSSFWLQPGSGGSPRRIGTVRGDFAGFGADGTSILVGKKDEIDSVSADGSSRKLITVQGFPFYLRISPDTRVLRFTLFSPDNDTMEIMEARPDGTALHTMLAGCCGEWTPDGRFFLFQDRRTARLDSLWSVAEGRTSWWRKRENKPMQLTSGPLDFQFSLPSKDGKRIFSIGTTRRAEVVRYDPHIREFIPYLPGISVETLAFSPDGKWVAYTSYPGGNLWRSKVDGSERLQLTFPPLRAFLPRWSPDGKQIAFHAKRLDTPFNIYLVSGEGGTPERILPSGENQMDVNWSPDGNSLVFGHAMPPNKPIHTMDLRSKRVSTLPGSIGLFSPHWSPDGRYITALKLRSSDTLELFDFVTQKWTEAWKTPPGSFMGYQNWSRDGKYIIFQNWSSQDDYRILRFRMSDRKIEEIANLKGIRRLNNPWYAATWLGIAPDDSPLLSRDISTQEIYALDIEWP
jgi:dipeptidyl aminopeptidase/acylaminoacyl peptidase